MLSCKQATELISQGLDRPLSVGERFSLAMHLAICQGCRVADRQLAQLREYADQWRRDHTETTDGEFGREGDRR